MYFEAPKGLHSHLRFVYDPEHIDNSFEDRFRFCGSVVIHESIKKEIDAIFSKIIDIPNFELPLEETYGSFIGKLKEDYHNWKLDKKETCPNYCICNFEKDVFWGHNLYQKILGEVAISLDVGKDELIGPSEIHRKKSAYIQKYDWPDNKKIGDSEGATKFILLTLLDIYRSHLNLGGIGSLDSAFVQDEAAFTDCKEGNHDYSFGREEIWSSKSTVEGKPEDSLFSSTRLFPGMKNQMVKPEMPKGPAAQVFRVYCKCSRPSQSKELKTEEYIYELWEFDRPPGDTYFSKPIAGRGKCREKSQSIQHDSDDGLLSTLFTSYFERVLTKVQAKVAAKLKVKQVLNAKITLSSSERHSKVLLKKNLEKMSRIYKYWADLEELME